MYTLLIEKSNDYPDCKRLVIIDTDEETGSKSVVDIVETHQEGCWHLFDAVSERYQPFEFSPAHASVDFGRARTNLSRMRKVAESVS